MYGMYLRKSRADDPNESIDETLAKHEKILFDLAASMKVDRSEIMVFKEVVSGESIQNRPEMQRLLRLVMEGVLNDGVFAVDSQRLARGDTLDQGTIIRAFSLTETKIITPIKIIDPANESDEEYFEFDLFMGRREYKMINRRMQRGRYISVQEGYYLGSVAPYGYKRIKFDKSYSLEIEQEEYQVFKTMKELALDGLGCTNIANELNDLGYKSRKKKIWTTSAVRDILLNKTNLGLIKWNTRKIVKVYKDGDIIATRPINKDPEYYPGKHPAIITQEEYDTISKSIRARNNAPLKKEKKLQNPLAGLIVCGVCGRKMTRRPFKNGRQESLVCPTSRCNNVSSDLNIIENKILDTLKSTLDDYKTFIDDYDHSSKKKYTSHKDNKLNNIEKEIEKVNKQIAKACEMLEIGAYDVKLFKERKKTLDDRILSLEKEKEALRKETSDNKVIQYRKAVPKIEKALALYWEASIEEKNNLLKSVIDKCVYKKEKSGRWNPETIDNFMLEIYMKF